MSKDNGGLEDNPFIVILDCLETKKIVILC